MPLEETTIRTGEESPGTRQSTELTNAAGERLKITATPAMHTSNPDLRDAVGEVTGFMLEWEGQPGGAFYISGDTVWIDEILENDG